MQSETVTNIFWGLFLIWFGVVATTLGGNFGATANSPLFALGTGVLLILLNLFRAVFHLKLSPLTIGLGALLGLIFAPIVFFGYNLPFLPALLIIVGIALVIGAIRTRKYY